MRGSDYQPPVPEHPFTGDIETYQGVMIDRSSLTPQQVQDVKTSLDFMDGHEDGGQLLQQLRHRNYTVKGDPDTFVVGSTTHSARTITLGPRAFWNGARSALETLVHESIHAATQPDGTSHSEEGLATTLGRRIRFDFEGAFTYVGMGDEELVFDGSDASEKLSYEDRIEEVKELGVYDHVGENALIFDSLEQLDIHFRFGPKAPVSEPGPYRQ